MRMFSSAVLAGCCAGLGAVYVVGKELFILFMKIFFLKMLLCTRGTRRSRCFRCGSCSCLVSVPQVLASLMLMFMDMAYVLLVVLEADQGLARRLEGIHMSSRAPRSTGHRFVFC